MATDNDLLNIAEKLRREAAVTEELHPDDSEIEVMREAADVIETLWDERATLRRRIDDLKQAIAQFHNHDVPMAFDAVAEIIDRERKKVRRLTRELLSAGDRP